MIQTGQGVIVLHEVQPPGKRAMSAADYLRGAGRQITIGSVLADS